MTGTLRSFAPATQEWFDESFDAPTPAQLGAWDAVAGDEHVLVVANLSRFVQYAELDLGAFRGVVPVEMLGRTPFPPIGELPYLLTLGAYGFYWFRLPSPDKPLISASPTEGEQA